MTTPSDSDRPESETPVTEDRAEELTTEDTEERREDSGFGIQDSRAGAEPCDLRLATCDSHPQPSTLNPQPSSLTSYACLLLGITTIALLTRYNLSGWSFQTGQPGRTWEEYLLVNVTALLFLPCLLVFGLLREEAAAFGVRLPDRFGSRIALWLYLLMLPVLLIASRLPTFQQYYPMQPQAADSWRYLLYFEVTYGFYMFSWEFFYRGFLTFGLARRFGVPAAIVLQAVGFGLMHWTKPAPEFYGSFIAGIALGLLAVRGRSFLPCFALHWAASVTFDLLIIQARPGGIF